MGLCRGMELGELVRPVAVAYIARVKDSLAQRTWEQPGF